MSKGTLYRRMGIAAIIVAGGVLLSRMLGLVRQIVFAWLLGAGATGDEYFVAFLIPDVLNYLLAGAYMAITLIPLLTKRFAAGDEADARRAFWAVTRPLTIGITALVLLAYPFVEPMLRLIEPGFTEDQVREAARLTRIVLPAQIFFVLGQLFTAWQFAREKFFIPTLGPIIYNLAIIAGGLAGGLGADDPGADGFAWGALVGAIVGIFLLQVWGAWRNGLRLPQGSLRRHPAIVRYFVLAIPLMLGQSLVVLDEQLGRTFGSLHADGGVSWLTFGRQTMLVPVGVIAQAAGVATYPFLARLVAEGKHRELARTAGRAIRFVLVFSLAATAALMAVSEPVVRLLFERGSFDSVDTLATAATVVLFALGIPMWGLQQILARGFYAREEMWAPVVIGTIATAAAIPIYWALNRSLGVEGLALASSVAITLYTIALAVLWFRRTGWDQMSRLALTLRRALPLAAAGGGAAWMTGRWLSDALGTAWWADALIVLIAAGLVVAFILIPPSLRPDVERAR